MKEQKYILSIYNEDRDEKVGSLRINRSQLELYTEFYMSGLLNDNFSFRCEIESQSEMKDISNI